MKQSRSEQELRALVEAKLDSAEVLEEGLLALLAISTAVWIATGADTLDKVGKAVEEMQGAADGVLDAASGAFEDIEDGEIRRMLQGAAKGATSALQAAYTSQLEMISGQLQALKGKTVEERNMEEAEDDEEKEVVDDDVKAMAALALAVGMAKVTAALAT